jgi:hypothetical protein
VLKLSANRLFSCVAVHGGRGRDRRHPRGQYWYWVGREFGYRLLLRFGGYIGLTTGKIKLGQDLFLRHGGKVVFFGRFVAILRILAAFLAGVNRMEWRRFLLAMPPGPSRGRLPLAWVPKCSARLCCASWGHLESCSLPSAQC